MDPVTHSVLGAIAGATVWRLNRRRSKANTGSGNQISSHPLAKHQAVGIGALAGLFPDIDIIAFLISPLYYDAYWHGTYTHSLVLAPLWAWLLTWVFAWLGQRIYHQRFSRAAIFIICLAGIGTHIAADVITAWDIGLLMPFHDARVSFGLMFLIDPTFTLLATLLLIALIRPWPRSLVLVCMCQPLAWMAVAGIYKHQALQLAHSSPTDVVEAPASAQLNAWPQPFALSHWKVVYSNDNGIWSADVRLSERPRLRWPLSWLERSAAGYEITDTVNWRFYPRHPTPVSERAWHRPEFQAVRDFMTYPVFLREDNQGCVWFTDWLFVIPGQEPPFQYAACQSTEGDWQVKRGQVAMPWAQ